MGAVGPISKAARGETRHGHPEGKSESGRSVVVALPAAVGRVIPAPPSHLSEVGATAYTEAAESAPWLHTPVDWREAVRWGELEQERTELVADIAKHGRRVKGSMGQWVSSPEVTQLRGLEAAQRAVAATLGIGSLHAARLGISVQALAPKQTSPFTELLERRAGGQ